MNPYDVLKVNKHANEKEIKDAYRQMSKAYHPDKPNGDVEKFKEIAAAYEILSDPEKKKMFDENGVVSTEDQIARKAQALIQQCFQTLVGQYGMERLLTVDVIAEMKSLMDQGIQELDNLTGKVKGDVSAAEKVLGKFTFEKKKNPIQAMLDNDISKNKALILQYNSEKVIAKRTYNLLKDYKFDADTAQFTPSTFKSYNHTVSFMGGTGGVH